MDYAFEFVIKNGGVDTEADYPYTASQGTCDKSKLNTQYVVIIYGYEDVPYNNESVLLQALAKQPISVAIEASGRDFQLHTSGVFTGSCSVELDHGVAVVGYGTDNGLDCWIERNSLGETGVKVGISACKDPQARDMGSAAFLSSLHIKLQSAQGPAGFYDVLSQSAVDDVLSK